MFKKGSITMKIFGHEWIEGEAFFVVKNEKDISCTSTNALLQLEPLSCSLPLAKYCQRNGLRYALETKSIEEALLGNLLQATYLICNKTLAVALMPIAQYYLFDTQILVLIKKDEIEEMAKVGVDGVIIV
jgi:hypothetical protein